MWQVVGQDKAVAWLNNSLKRGHLSHAYLFVGPPHVGKMTLAQNLAQALNCEGEEPPCNECVSCRRIAAAKHADVQVIGLVPGGGMEIGIDRIREINRMVSLPPYEGKYKVFIIDGAEGLSDEAANCLLKTLEEPPPKAVLILLAARERLLLPTLISRCQRLELFPLSVSCIEKVLIERSGVAPPRAELLARLSGGCLGWALCLQRDEGLLEKRSNELDTLAKLIGAGREHRLAYAASLASLSSRNREQVEEMLTLWIEWWRDMLLVKGSAESFITNIDRHSTLSYQAKGYSLKQIQVYLGMIRGALEQLNQNANPRLVLEVLMLRMPYPETMANN